MNDNRNPAAAVADLSTLDGRRLLARLIDGMLIGGAAVWLHPVLEPFGWAGMLLLLLGVVAYFFIWESFTGRTAGKVVTGLRVVRRDGQRARVSDIATRNVVRIIEEPFVALIALVASGRRRRQRVGDLLAGTTVGRARYSAPPAPSILRVVYPAVWAAGALAFAMLAEEPREISGSYPPAPSLAGPMTPEWEAFAERVDRTCAESYNRGQGWLAQVGQRAEAEGWSKSRTESTLWHVQATSQAATHEAIVALGDPPARVALFRRWRDNVGQRARLMTKQSRLWANGRRGMTSIVGAQISARKIDANWLGQRFGLRICTSNAPGRESRESYLRKVNDVCVERRRRDGRLWRRGRATPNAIAGNSKTETLMMAAVGPATEEYQLRRRILRMKRKLDRQVASTFSRVASSADQRSAWRRARPRLVRADLRVRAQLVELGLPGCVSWSAPGSDQRFADLSIAGADPGT